MRVFLLLILFYSFVFSITVFVQNKYYLCWPSSHDCQPCDNYFNYGYDSYISCSDSLMSGFLYEVQQTSVLTSREDNCRLYEDIDSNTKRYVCDQSYTCKGSFNGDMSSCEPCPTGTQYNSDSDTCEPICSSDHIYDSANNICLCPDGQVENLSGNCVVEDCIILSAMKQSECDSLGKLLNGNCVFDNGQLISNTLYCADPAVASCNEIQTAFFEYPPDCGGGVPVISCDDNGGNPIVDFYCKVSPDTQVGGNTALSTQIDNLNTNINNNFDSLNTKIDSLPDNTQKLNCIESKIDNIKDPTTQLNDIQNDLSTLDTLLSSKIDNINIPNYSTELTNLSTQNVAIQSSQIGINSKLDTLNTNIKNSIDNLDSENSNIVKTLRDVQTAIDDSKVEYCTTLDLKLGVMVNGACVPYSPDDEFCLDGAPKHSTMGCDRTCESVGWISTGGGCVKQKDCNTIRSECAIYCNSIGKFLDSYDCTGIGDCTCKDIPTPTPSPTPTPTPELYCKTINGLAGVKVDGECVAISSTPTPTPTPTSTPDLYCKTTNGLAGVKVNGECVAISSTPEPTPSPTSTPDLYCKTTNGLAGVKVNGECVAISSTPGSIPIPTITISVNATISTGISKSDLDDLGTSIGSDLDNLSSDLTSGNSCACPPTCSKFYNSSTDIWKCNCNGSIKDCGSSLSFNDEDLNDIDNVEEDTEGLDTLKSYVTSNEFNNYTSKFKIEDISCPSWDENEVSFEISLDIPFINYHISENKAFATSETMDSLPYGIIVKILYFLVGLRLFIGFIRS